MKPWKTLARAVLAGAALTTMASLAHAQGGPDPFPITLASTTYAPPEVPSILLVKDHGGVRLTWHSTIPGLGFCVAYATARGLYSDENDHCMTTDRHGNAIDNVRLSLARDLLDPSNVVLLATVVLVDNRFSTVLVPIDTWKQAIAKDLK